MLRTTSRGKEETNSLRNAVQIVSLFPYSLILRKYMFSEYIKKYLRKSWYLNFWKCMAVLVNNKTISLIIKWTLMQREWFVKSIRNLCYVANKLVQDFSLKCSICLTKVCKLAIGAANLVNDTSMFNNNVQL